MLRPSNALSAAAGRVLLGIPEPVKAPDVDAHRFPRSREERAFAAVPKEPALRLLRLTRHVRFEPGDYRAYCRTAWFKHLKEVAKRTYRTCVGCGKPGCTVHHRPIGYEFLFDENVLTHVVWVCNRCHRNLEA